MKKVFVVCVAAAAALVTAANAESMVLVRGFAPTMGGETVQRQIGLKYEAPANAQSAAALLEKINTVALSVCTGTAGGKSALLAAKVERCKARAVKQAVDDIDSPELTTAAAATAK